MLHHKTTPTQVTKTSDKVDVFVLIGMPAFLFKAYNISGGTRPRSTLKPIFQERLSSFLENKPIVRE